MRLPAHLRFYLTLDGRISRKAIWIAVIAPLIVLTAIVAAIDLSLWPNTNFALLGVEYTPASFALTLLVLWPSFATAIRRFHDLNMTGWWALLFIPVYLWMPDMSALFQGPAVSIATDAIWIGSLIGTIVIAIMQLFTRGTRGENRFGSDPLAK